MSEHTVQVVFDMESGEPFPLGRYDHTDEDTVVYYDAQGRRMIAPQDCVTVVRVTVGGAA